MRKFKSKLTKAMSFILSFAFMLTLLPVNYATATEKENKNSKAASGVPGKALLQHDQYGNDSDGNYNISFSMWYGNNGTSYKLYERIGIKNDFTVVSEGELKDESPNPQNGTVEITGRTIPGTYYYYLELTNSFGTTKSDTITLRVGSAETSKIVIDKIDDHKTEVQFTIPQGASEYKLVHVDAKDPKFKVISSNTSSVKASIVNGDTLKVEGVGEGRSGLKIVEETTGEIRQIGCRVLKSDGKTPGMPNYLSIGQVSEDTDNDLNFWKDTATDDTNKRTDIRYIYINGGPISGWRTWTSEDGARAKKYITESLKLGMIPFFVYYNIPDDAEDYAVDLAHINDKAYLEAYFKDLKFLLDICKEYAGDETVGMVFEPDFLGYMMQQSGKQPNEISAVVDAAFSSGVLEKGKDPEFENSVKGLVEAINYTVEKYYPQAYNGWQFNTWAFDEPGIPSQGLLHKTELVGMEEGQKYIEDVARKTAEYYLAAGINSYGTEFISIDKYGLDGAYEPGAAADPKGSKWLWNSDIWNNYLLYTKTLHKTTEQPVILWQIPVGHLNSSEEVNPYDSSGKFKDLTNEVGNYEDSAPDFFFGDTFNAGGGKRTEYFGSSEYKDPKIKADGDKITWESHMEETKDAGVVSILFGAGVGASTDAVGSPAPDNYWWITKAQRYLKNPLPLDPSNIQQPENNLPRKPLITADSAENKGNYTISGKVPEKSLASSYKLFENGKEIKSGTVSDKALDINVPFTDKAVGEYKYYIELTNTHGKTLSDTISVKVVKDTPKPDPEPTPDPKPEEDNVNIDFEITQDWGAGANYQLTITNKTNKEISNWNLSFEFAKKISNAWDVALSEKNGVYNITPSTWNSKIPAGKSISFGGACDGGVGSLKPTNIKFTADGLNTVTPENPSLDLPVKATLTANTTSSKDGNYSVSLNLPSNHKATRYEVFENGKSIKSASISSSTSTIKEDLKNKAEGNYTYEAVLKNKNGETKTSKITVTVKPEANGGGQDSPSSNQWKSNTNYKAGDTANYNNKTYKCLQPHLSLNGWEPSNVPALWQVK